MMTVTELLAARLESLSTEEFLRDWNEVVSLGLISPTVKQYFSVCDIALEDKSPGNYKFSKTNTTFEAPLKSGAFLFYPYVRSTRSHL